MAQRTWMMPHAKQAVVQAIHQVVAQNRWQMDDANAAAGWLRFHTGLSFWTWSGQDVAVYLRDAAGGVQMDVSAKIRRKGLAFMQLIDMGEGSRVANKVISDTCRLLGIPGP